MKTLMALLLLTSLPVVAGHAAEPADPEGLKRFSGSEVLFGKDEDFSELRLALGPIEWSGAEAKVKPHQTQTVEGRLSKRYYVCPPGPSVLEVYRNYANELKASGFEILFQARGEELETRSYNNQVAREIFRITKPYGSPEESADWMLAVCDDGEAGYIAARRPTADGAFEYVSLYVFPCPDVAKNFFGGRAAGRVVVRLEVCRTGAMEQRMELVTSERMGHELGEAGRVVLYGITFDFNKTEIKPESRATLAEVAKLLSEKPGLKLLVVGHTDNQGGFEFNRDLSQRRAAAVVETLKRDFRVDGTRLFPFGVSYASPVASNEEEAGRALNRRVELVELVR